VSRRSHHRAAGRTGPRLRRPAAHRPGLAKQLGRRRHPIHPAPQQNQRPGAQRNPRHGGDPPVPTVRSRSATHGPVSSSSTR